MKLNIISTQINSEKNRGPKKVLQNLTLGLDKLGVKYVFNKPLNKYEKNWIHDSPAALIEAGFLNKPVILGPNIAELPNELPFLRKKLHKDSIYLHPSEWPIKIWHYEGYDETVIRSWPVGIDTEKFAKVDRTNKNKVLIYFKQRQKKLLEIAKKIIEEMNLEYSIIEYGKYSEQEYMIALDEAKFGIWIGCSESQGIALQEAMATNLPLIIINSSTLFANKIKPKRNRFKKQTFKKLKFLKTTSAPYFDKKCGIIINSTSELKKSIIKLNSEYVDYNPREYILKNLTLEQSAIKFINFYKGMDLSIGSKYNYKSISILIYLINMIFQYRTWKTIMKKFFRIY